MRLPVCLALLLVVFVPVASAEQLHSAGDQGQLSIEIVVSPTKDFIREWSTLPATKAIHVSRIRTVVRDQTVYVAFLISGYSADEKRAYNFSVSYRLLRANGSVVAEQKDYAAGNRQMPKRPSFVMANPALDLTLDNTDSYGKYTLEATVEDRAAQKSSTASYKFELVK